MIVDIADFITRVGFPVAVAVYLLMRQHKQEERMLVQEARCAAENKALRDEILLVKTKDQETLRELGRTMKETNRLVRHIFKIVDDDRTPMAPSEIDSDSRHKAISESPTETIVRRK
jgi:hypothetical protein